MNDILSVTDIKNRSVKGTIWLLIMNSLGIPAIFLVTVMLGRVGPELLGVYALVQILIGVIITFFIYGGGSVISVLLPKILGSDRRGRFLFSYIIILFGMMSMVLLLFWYFPKAFEFLLQQKFDMNYYGWFVLLAVVVVLSETLINTANGLLLIKTSAIARQMIRFVLLPLVAILFFFDRNILADYGIVFILGSFIVGYILAAVVSIISIYQDKRLKIQIGWLLPKGFWNLSLSIMAASIFSFLYTNFDRIAVLSINDVAGLGKYQAVISISMLIGFVPKILGTSLVSMFSSLLATGKKDAVIKAYNILQRTGSIFMTVTALFLIAYNNELLSMFGESYSDYDYLLSMFCVTAVITSVSFGNTPILIAYEKNFFRFFVSLTQITIQITGTLVFIQPFGIIAIAGAKITGVLVASISNITCVVFKMRKGFCLPRTYKSGVVISLLLSIIRFFVEPTWIISTALFLFSCICFFLVGKITIRDIKDIANLFLRRNKEYLFLNNGIK